jgi:hypothetical protein
MKAWKYLVLICFITMATRGLAWARLIWPGFSSADEPSYLEKTLTRAARKLAISRKARLETNPLTATREILQEARESFLDSECRGPDGSGQTIFGRNPNPEVPDLRFDLATNSIAKFRKKEDLALFSTVHKFKLVPCCFKFLEEVDHAW